MAPSLRQVKHQGNDDMLRERFDSIFRRNMIELDAPSKEYKRRDQKRQVKFKNRRGVQFGGTVSASLASENAKLKQNNRDKESKQFLQNDMILI